jgi:hypothetical protein
MKRRQVLTGLLALALLAALTVGLSQAQGPGLGSGHQPEEGHSSQAAHGPEGAYRPGSTAYGGIPVQGRLTDAAGKPVPDGEYTLTYRLYESLYGGDPLCEDVDGPPEDPLSPVQVNGGLFHAFVDGCSAEVLDGRWLYLGLEVGEDGEMSPRQVIGTVPYARSLQPGAHIVGDVLGGSVLYVDNTSDGFGRGLSAHSRNGTALGVGSDHADVAGSFTGSVRQSGPDHGLLKAAVYADCRDSGSSITRSFSYLKGITTVIDGNSAGRCTLDFDDSIVRLRFFSATAFPSAGDTARGVSCGWGAVATQLDCFRWKADGSGANGEIMVVIY